MTDAVESIASLSPSRWSSSKSMASLPTFLTAPSPRSSPRATLILSAASTNSKILSVAVIPSLPASPANSFRRSREVRVSMARSDSLSSSTASAESPVYLRTCACASSMVAKSFTTSWSVSRTLPKTSEKVSMFSMSPNHLLPQSASLSLKERLSLAAISSFTSRRASFVLRMASVSASHSLLPRSILPELSSRVSSRRVRWSSLGVDLSRLASALLMPWARVSVRWISFSSLLTSRV